MDTQAARRTVQVCTSKPIPFHHGDRAIVFDAFAAQDNSGWGKSHIRANEPKPFSDAHDVVLVPLCWSHLQSAGGAARPALPPGAMEPQIIKPGSPRNQESPPDSPQPIDAKTQLTIPWVSTEDETSSSAARPDSLELDRFGDFESEPMIHTGDFHFGNADAAPSLMLPSPETLLYNAFLDKLASTGDEDVMECLAEFGVFDKLRFKKPYGSAEPPADKRDDPYQLGLRTEHLLTVTNTQRSNHIARLASRHDIRDQSPHAHLKSFTPAWQSFQSSPEAHRARGNPELYRNHALLDYSRLGKDTK